MSHDMNTPAEQHTDHRLWKRELSMWRDDVELWQQEHEGARKALEFAIATLALDKEALSEHVATISDLEMNLNFHEMNLAESLKGLGDSDLDLNEILTDHHNKQQKTLAKQRSEHERLKKRNHIAVAQITSMLTALSARDKK